ncbi:MAG TPA: ELWxxDGT repeat protein [Thermoanaerobaculia bacterium]|nr:ELWxxDGT repeat protein [Thermoanaerobaculia bacterium]
MALRRVLSLAIPGLLAGLPMLGQAPAYLVKDINPDTPLPRVEETAAESEGVGSLFYYAANDGTHGTEVWRTDGTAAGTFMLKDICPGACSSRPRTLTSSNGLLFFVAQGPQGPGLWKSDGTPGGTSLVKGDLSGVQSFADFLAPTMVDAGGKLLFTVLAADDVLELWITDGTPGGTHAVGDAARGFIPFFPPRFLAVDHGQVLFAAQDSLTTWEPWVTDGTNAGTHRLSEVNPGAGSPIRFNNLGPAGQEAVAAPWGGFVFVGDDGSHGPEIWRTDGTAAGTVQIKDIASGSSGSSPLGLAVFNGKVLFNATDPTHGSEIWTTDGTAAGTGLLLDVQPGGSGSDPREITAVGSLAFFRADDGTHGAELWATDGTTAGTRMVKDVVPGSAGGLPPTAGGYEFTAIGGRLVFYSATVVGGLGSFWTSDGTDAGTQPLAPVSGSWPYVDVFSQGIDGHGVDNHGVAGGRLFFRGDFTPSFWVTDGTMAGSYKILDVPVATSSFAAFNGNLDPGLLAALNGTLFFQATDGISNYELWRSDGTDAGTSQVSDLGSALPRYLNTVNGHLAFIAFYNSRLGLSDGTTAGTEIVPGSSVRAFATKPLGNELFFLSQPDSAPAGLWKTDGTAAGTVLVATHDSVIPGGSPVPSGGKIFYSLLNGASYYDLWVSDGTAGGTSLLGPGFSPQSMTDAGGTFFFSAFPPGSFYYTLWKSDGTAAGTVQVADVNVVTSFYEPFAVLPGGTILFQAQDGTHGQELWRSDGTGAGTVLVKDVLPGPASSRISGLTVAGSRAFFAADDGVHGIELWVSDGTAAGTHLVKDIVPGAGSSFPFRPAAVGSVVVFSAFDPEYGVEAWRSDGTDAGTWRLADVAPGPLSSNPLGFTVSGSRLYFTADDNTTGSELWAIPRKYVTGTFADVPPNYWAWRFIESLAASGVTGGCGDGDFCPGDYVNRAQMAIFVLAARGTVPPPATGTRFDDVPAGYWAGPWIEELAREGVVSGCSGNLYCPDNLLTRAEMAVLLTVSRGENPPLATGTRFADVPADYWAARFIEQLAADGITAGCGGGNYCPDLPITRGEMAVFLATAFHLPLP